MDLSIRQTPPPPSLPSPAGDAAHAGAAASGPPPEPAGRAANEAPLAHAPSARDYSYRRRLLTQLAGTLVGSVPMAAGNVLAGAALARAQHTPMQHALRDAGIATGYTVATLAAASVLMSAVAHRVERARGDNRMDLPDRQLKTGLASAFVASTGGVAINLAAGVAAQRTGGDGRINMGHAAVEAVVSGAMADVLAAAGMAVAYMSSDRVARVSSGMAARGVRTVLDAWRRGRGGQAASGGGSPQAIELVPPGPGDLEAGHGGSPASRAESPEDAANGGRSPSPPASS